MSDNALGSLFQTAAIIGAFWGLLKWTVTDKLKTISTDIGELKAGRKEDTDKIHAIDKRVAQIEERHRQIDTWGGSDRRAPGREAC